MFAPRKSFLLNISSASDGHSATSVGTDPFGNFSLIGL
ncbi:hypothetical protein EVA_19237 [gut metagenome]|uniref:Uncharacterized protein n=1 Tax=gut metagenome TaxID=749906 RepID=J9FSW6_9ZZZZ